MIQAGFICWSQISLNFRTSISSASPYIIAYTVHK